jgi:hypothetical protein
MAVDASAPSGNRGCTIVLLSYEQSVTEGLLADLRTAWSSARRFPITITAAHASGLCRADAVPFSPSYAVVYRGDYQQLN